MVWFSSHWKCNFHYTRRKLHSMQSSWSLRSVLFLDTNTKTKESREKIHWNCSWELFRGLLYVMVVVGKFIQLIQKTATYCWVLWIAVLDMYHQHRDTRIGQIKASTSDSILSFLFVHTLCGKLNAFSQWLRVLIVRTFSRFSGYLHLLQVANITGCPLRDWIVFRCCCNFLICCVDATRDTKTPQLYRQILCAVRCIMVNKCIWSSLKNCNLI